MSVPDRASPRSDAMPTTRGTTFDPAETNLEFVLRDGDDAVCKKVAAAEALAVVTAGPS
jgi:hypothetical protein